MNSFVPSSGSTRKKVFFEARDPLFRPPIGFGHGTAIALMFDAGAGLANFQDDLSRCERNALDMRQQGRVGQAGHVLLSNGEPKRRAIRRST